MGMGLRQICLKVLYESISTFHMHDFVWIITIMATSLQAEVWIYVDVQSDSNYIMVKYDFPFTTKLPIGWKQHVPLLLKLANLFAECGATKVCFIEPCILWQIIQNHVVSRWISSYDSRLNSGVSGWDSSCYFNRWLHIFNYLNLAKDRPQYVRKMSISSCISSLVQLIPHQ